MDLRASTPATVSRRPPSTASRTATPSTATVGGRIRGSVGTGTATGNEAGRVEVKVEPRVRRIEQQLQEKLPPEWRAFAGAPMQIQYYDKTINTFRENKHVKPSESYIRHAVTQLRQQLELEKMDVLSDQELRDVVCQEWRTDLTRSVWQARLNRHGSMDGPVVRRSKSGVITVTSQPTADEKRFVIDEMAQQKKPSRKTKP